MRTVTIADLRKNFDELLAQTIQFDEPLTVTTAAGNAVILSEANYNSMRETLYLTSIPGMERKLRDALTEKPSTCVAADDVEW